MKILIALLILLPTIVFAKGETATMTGTVESVNEKTVVLEKDGKRYTLPRKYFGRQMLKQGKTATTARLNVDKIKELQAKDAQ